RVPPRRGDAEPHARGGARRCPRQRGAALPRAQDPGRRMSDLTRSTAADIAATLADGSTTSVEVTQQHLDRIGAVDDRIHAYLHVDAEGALATAADIDRRRQAGESLHGLAGVPIA